MRRIGAVFLAGFLAALCSGGPAAKAQSLDLAKMTCKEFLDSDKARRDLIIAWLEINSAQPQASWRSRCSHGLADATAFNRAAEIRWP